MKWVDFYATPRHLSFLECLYWSAECGFCEDSYLSVEESIGLSALQAHLGRKARSQVSQRP